MACLTSLFDDIIKCCFFNHNVDFFQKTKYRCSRLKIEVDCSAAKSWVEIDAVRITGTKDSGETVTNKETKNMEQSSDIIEHWVSAVIDFSSQYDNKR